MVPFSIPVPAPGMEGSGIWTDVLFSLAGGLVTPLTFGSGSYVTSPTTVCNGPPPLLVDLIGRFEMIDCPTTLVLWPTASGPQQRPLVEISSPMGPHTPPAPAGTSGRRLWLQLRPAPLSACPHPEHHKRRASRAKLANGHQVPNPESYPANRSGRCPRHHCHLYPRAPVVCNPTLCRHG